ncbi:RNA-binding protein 2-like [Rhodamnia argentea]|uniref:RNA-binding protein 2-like n=1 Tax=Rhodamnia argentea TaxID=178133 RepID=A0A8B8PBZ6_9MYRT|nr:RNA-binding protein 2-like [Rhodamnia argentea]XP_048126944.1 RNA-binding protein 2-like [Rhodamnia argentea]
MADPYWGNFSDARLPPYQPPPAAPGKRPRTDFDVPTGAGHDIQGYLPIDDNRGAFPGIRDTESLGASYDLYLHATQMSPFSGAQPTGLAGAGTSAHSFDDLPMVGLTALGQMTTMAERTVPFEAWKDEVPLPPDASNILFVEGLPPKCSRREVSHIFRPFVGYKEVRLVNKESRQTGKNPVTLCFVDFASPAHAATAKDALQGYVFDEHDRDSNRLRLQFARYPGAKSGGGYRGKR